MAFTSRKINMYPRGRTQDYIVQGTGSVGACVYIHTSGTNEGRVSQTDADAEGTAQGIGIIVRVAGNVPDNTSYTSGDTVTVCYDGVLTGFASLTPGVLQYVGTSPGALVETAPGAGDFANIIGYAVNANTLRVDPSLTLITGS